MPDCQQYRTAVNQLRAQVTEVKQECDAIDDLRERRQCLQMLAQLRDRLKRAEAALKNCESGLPSPGVRSASGHVNFLRVNEGGYGPPDDFLNLEVIFKLDTQPGRAFGFSLKPDADEPAHEGALSLLLAALEQDLNMTIDFEQELNRANSRAFRFAITS
jgi:hypothetical protein